MAASITTLATLRTAVANWLNRAGDTVITSNIDDFIANFESNLLNSTDETGKPLFRVREMEIRATTPLSGQFMALPTDFLQMRLLKVNSNPIQKLDYVSPEFLFETWVSNVSGRALCYTITESELAFGPIPQSADTLEMWYYAFARLTDAAPTNWLITKYPNIYLYGALTEAAEFIDDPKASFWAEKAGKAVQDLYKADQAARWSGSSLNMHTDSGAP